MTNGYRPSEAKRKCLEKLSTTEGVISALAMDQRRSLRKMIAAAAGCAFEAIPDAQLVEFKTAVTERLSGEASAVLLDPEYGLPAASQRDPRCGLILTYELDGFENPRPQRMLELLPQMSVTRLAGLGGLGVKVLLSWSPEDDEAANDRKKALIERIGAECDAVGLAFFLEPVTYDPAGGDVKSVEFARAKPGLVVRTMEEFSQPHYRVDVLKVEFPVTAAYVEGSPVYRGTRAYTMAEALEWYRAGDAAARRPYIYLSAGVSTPEFLASLEMAAESGARFSGVLCGRANWQGGAGVFVRGGAAALSAWLAEDGVRNIRAVNERVRAATPWHVWA